MPEETIGKTVAVAVGVCVVCSVFVSTTAVFLKPVIDTNKTIDKKRNILIAAAVPGAHKLRNPQVEGEFASRIDALVIDITTGETVPETEVDPAKLDERRAAKDPKQRVPIPETQDDPGLKWRSKFQSVYRTKAGSGEPRIILPVHGKGLWSTMYGFVALDANDLNTIKSFAFYEHGETPGLGGEVDNPNWKDLWVGKKAFDDPVPREEIPEPKILVVKGTADRDSLHEIDGLSGATLTAGGVRRLVRFWLSKDGYGKFLKLQRERLNKGEQDG